jgi:hypothetical protein
MEESLVLDLGNTGVMEVLAVHEAPVFTVIVPFAVAKTFRRL